MHTKNPDKGGILIEFTFSIPVCIALLFFVNDHYRIYELKNKLKSSTYLAASMIQHVTNTKSDKQLTTDDIGRIAYASCLNLFHTNSMFNPWPLGIAFSIDYYYVKRIDNNSYQYQYGWGSTDWCSDKPSPKTMSRGCDSVVTKNRSEIETLHPNLVCDKDGDERLIIFCCYRRMKNFNKSKIGLFFMEPGAVVGGVHTNHAYKDFLYQNLVITPKPGLFPVKNSS